MKSRSIILLLIIFTSSLFISSQEIISENPSDIINSLIHNLDSKELFQTYHKLFNKTYEIDSEEGAERYANFLIKLEKVKSHNLNNTEGYELGLNQFSDMSQSEFKRKMLTKKSLKQIDPLKDSGYDINGLYFIETLIPLNNIPASNTWKPIDYTPQCGKVFRQGNCGCCYTFAMLNAMECNYRLKKGFLPVLSRQQVVDCNAISHGCHGGSPVFVGIYAKSVGLMLDSEYPYKEIEGVCRYDKMKAFSYIDGIEAQPNPTRNSGRPNPYQNSWVIYNMLQKGVVVVGIDGNSIQDYKRGIIALTSCYDNNHAVIVTGFGVDSVAGPYWIVKNQWDVTWGENGYGRFKVREDSYGNCFINSDPIRPFVN